MFSQLIHKVIQRTSFFILILALLPALKLSAQESSFGKVDAYLEQGGVVYGFLDVQGDLSNLAESATRFILQMQGVSADFANVPPLPYARIVELTGLTQIKAMGLSSTRLDEGFQNRTFLLTEGSPTGLLAFGGTANQDFAIASFAPEAAVLVYEQSIDTDALLRMAKELAALFMGPDGGDMVEMQLLSPIPGSNFTGSELLAALNGRVSALVSINDSETIVVPELGTIPRVEFLIRMESAADLVAALAEMDLSQQLPTIQVDASAERTVLSGWSEESFLEDLVLMGNSASDYLYLSSSIEFLDSCLDNSGEKLADTALYKESTRDFPTDGTALVYVAPKFGELIALFMDKSIESGGAEAELARPYFEWSMQAIVADYPMVGYSRVEPEGLFYLSNWSVSHKRNLATVAYANPVTVGLMAAMAIPAFQKVRVTSQEKAITNNLRQLASAADQYFLENGVTTVETRELIGPNAYIPALDPVKGETYPETISMEDTMIKAVLPDGSEVSVDF